MSSGSFEINLPTTEVGSVAEKPVTEVVRTKRDKMNHRIRNTLQLNYCSPCLDKTKLIVASEG